MKTPLTFLTVLLASTLSPAQIRTDASLGQAARTLSGPNYAIPQTLGKLSGNNLFHSFQTFNLSTGEAANFSTTSPGIANIISRVTGGDASQINGTLRLNAANGAPAFFFINPAGITFGAGASVDVPGAFHVSTANSVKFADGRFNADLGSGSTFSSAEPEAFGFLGSTRASINVKDNTLVKARNGFATGVVAGDIVISNGGTVGALAAQVQVVAVGGAALDVPLTGPVPMVLGSVRLSGDGSIQAENLGDRPTGAINVHAGDLTLTQGGYILSSNTGAGSAADIRIEANTATLGNKGFVYSFVTDGGSGKGADIDLKVVQGLTISHDASVSTETFARGHAGHVRVNAGQITIDSNAYIASLAPPKSAGATGSIDIAAAGPISLANGSVYIQADASGAAGAIRIAGADIRLSDSALVFIFSAAGVPSSGDIVFEAQKTLALSDGSAIAINFESRGTPGNVRLTGDNIVLDKKSIIFTGPGPTGGVATVGSILIRATSDLDIRDGSKISSSAFSDGDAGSIRIQAGNIHLDNGSVSALTGGGTGNGGAVDIAATGRIALSNDSAITANSFTSGNAGSISIKSAELSLSGGSSVGSKTVGDVLSSGEVVPGGNAGDIRIITLGTLAISDGSISTSTSTTGKGGLVDVNANVIYLDGTNSNINAAAVVGSTGKPGSLNLRADEAIILTNSALITNANFANATPADGQTASVLSLTAPKIYVASRGIISTEATGLMSAGSIDIAAGQLSLASGTLRTSAEQGNGGNISARSNLITLTQARIVTSVTGDPTASSGVGAFGNGGNIRIDADTLLLNTGFIQANTAATNAVGGLVNLKLKTLVTSGNSVFVGGKLPYPFTPSVFGFNVIQAAAPTGVSGAIDITSPVLDLSGTLGRLGTPQIDTVSLGRSPCQTTGGSSLAQVGQGALPVSYRGLLGGVTARPTSASSASSVLSPVQPLSPSPAASKPPGRDAATTQLTRRTQLAQLAPGCQ